MQARFIFLITGVLFALAASTPASAETTQAKIARALSAGPASITATAAVDDMDAKGKITVLRKGTNDYTCFPGHPGVVGDDPLCMDQASMQWADDWFKHKPKPTNTKPGVTYMLAGGSDWSASDPFATAGTPIKEPPHWMIMWPFDSKTSGLPTTLKTTGTWIMYAGTPYAHLMINGKP